MRARSLLIGVALVGLVAGACANSDSGTSNAGGASGADGSSSPMGGMSHSGNGSSFDFGTPGDPSDVDRTVQISQLDTQRFEPSTISAEMGETIGFEITNMGDLPHEFVLGDDAMQSEHESEMAEMGGAMPADEDNAVVIDPGDTKTLVWTFTTPGTVIFGCHIEGHFVAGMVGEITVAG